ncbi:uncharacterized protein TNCV_4026101 [Trichonephila clavipes]|nr:uncharacterized protein TNCV_4026101 [Trichonephila clavipes]
MRDFSRSSLNRLSMTIAVTDLFVTHWILDKDASGIGRSLPTHVLSSLLVDCSLLHALLYTLHVAAVAEWYRYRIVACLVTSSIPVPLKTRRVGQRCTLNLSRAETSSRWCGVVVRRGGCQLRCRPRHLTMVQNYVVHRQKPSCS